MAIVEDVAEHPDAPIKDIVARTGLAQSLVSRTVDQLQRRGVLKVARDPADGRRSLVRINPRIRRGDFASRGSRPVSAALHRRLPNLDAHRRARVEAALDVLADELLDRASG